MPAPLRDEPHISGRAIALAAILTALGLVAIDYTFPLTWLAVR